MLAIDADSLIKSSKVLLLNGFIKKSTADYSSQIEIALYLLPHCCSLRFVRQATISVLSCTPHCAPFIQYCTINCAIFYQNCSM